MYHIEAENNGAPETPRRHITCQAPSVNIHLCLVASHLVFRAFHGGLPFLLLLRAQALLLLQLSLHLFHVGFMRTFLSLVFSASLRLCQFLFVLQTSLFLCE